MFTVGGATCELGWATAISLQGFGGAAASQCVRPTGDTHTIHEYTYYTQLTRYTTYHYTAHGYMFIHHYTYML